MPPSYVLGLEEGLTVMFEIWHGLSNYVQILKLVHANRYDVMPRYDDFVSLWQGLGL